MSEICCSKELTHAAVLAANISYHDKIAQQYEKDASTLGLFEEGKGSKARIRSVLEGLSQKTHAKTLLDLGCGTGNVLSVAKDYFAYAVGVDASLEMLKIVWDRGFDATYADILTLPFENDFFDVVTAFSVIHHVFSPKDLFREVYRVLKPGGYIYTDWDPNARAVAFFDAEAQSAVFKLVHMLYMSVKRLVRKVPANVRQESSELERLAEIAEYHHHQRKGLDTAQVVKDMAEVGFRNMRVFYHNNARRLFEKRGCSELARVTARAILNGRFWVPAVDKSSAQFAVLAQKWR